jgi:hypothetical protein
VISVPGRYPGRGITEMKKTLFTKIAALVLGTLGLTATALCAQNLTLPEATALPIRFVQSIDAKKARVNDSVTAKTLQTIALPSGQHIAKGATVVGHVTAVEAYSFDTTPYAHQKPSLISIHFDKVQQGQNAIPVNLFVRAMAGSNDSHEAYFRHIEIDTDTLGTYVLIGGTTYSPLDKMIQTEDGDAIAYNRKDGLFARLLPAAAAGAASFSCAGTSTEQSIAIYSPDACGLYGFPGNYMSGNGHDGSGTFTLSARGRSVKVPAGSTALLQAN